MSIKSKPQKIIIDSGLIANTNKPITLRAVIDRCRLQAISTPITARIVYNDSSMITILVTIISRHHHQMQQLNPLLY